MLLAAGAEKESCLTARLKGLGGLVAKDALPGPRKPAHVDRAMSDFEMMQEALGRPDPFENIDLWEDEFCLCLIKGT